MERPKLNELAVRIADGEPVDWPQTEAGVANPDDRDLLPHLQIVEHIARLHASVAASLDLPAQDSALSAIREAGDGDQEQPARWGPLTILERVGRGTFGDVYRAHDPRLDRIVALKLMRHPERDGEALESAVIQEARLMARVRHPNVLTIYGAERISGRVGLWMQYIEGPTLEAELQTRGKFAAAEVLAVGLDVSAALEAVHHAGLLHRDIKAQNVLRDVGGRTVLTDFGAGHDVGDSGSAAHRNQLAGTPLYLAPEVLAGGAASVQSDLYSLGVLLFHLATGSFPVVGKQIRDLRDAHSRGLRRRLREAGPDVPASLSDVIDRMLELEPARRPKQAAEVHEALSHVRAAAAANDTPGETLDRRLARGRLSLDEALRIGHQLAEAIEAAHRRGATVGSVTPATLKLTVNGHLALIDRESGADPAATPALLDDVSVFGRILFELLTGQPPADDVEWRVLEPDTPDIVRFLLQRCLERNPSARLQSMADARLMLHEGLQQHAAAAARNVPTRRVWRASLWAAALLAVAAAAIGIGRAVAGAPQSAPTATTRMTIALTGGHLRGTEGFAVSPDGTRIVFASQDGTPTPSHLYIRAVNNFAPSLMPSTEQGARPFFSPDGKWVGFFAGDDIKKVSLAGGPSIYVARAPGNWGAAWGPDDVIVYGSDHGLWQVSAAGGSPALIARADLAGGERSYRWPQILADGSIVFTIWKGALASDVGYRAPTGQVTRIVENGGKARYIDGFLLFTRRNSLLAAPFTPGGGAPGPARSVVNGVRSDANSGAAFAVSDSGSLVYAPGDLLLVRQRYLTLVGQDGAEKRLPFPLNSYDGGAMSPDGRHIAVTIQQPVGNRVQSSLWVGDVTRGTLSLMSSGESVVGVTFTPDSRRVTYRKNGGALCERPVDLSEPENVLLRADAVPNGIHSGTWSADGQTLMLSGHYPDTTTGSDLWLITGLRSPAAKVTPWLRGPSNENVPVFSPDGKFVAYQSDETGRTEVYVRPFSGGPAVQVSEHGTMDQIRWDRRGLVFLQARPFTVIEAPTDAHGRLTSRPPTPRLDVKVDFLTFAPPGAELLGMKGTQATELQPPPVELSVVLNWLPELRTRDTGNR